MASTRNRNTVGDYTLEQMRNASLFNYRSDPVRRFAPTNHQVGFGVMQGQIPHQAYGQNAVDVESYLMGVGSTRLVKHDGMVYNYHVEPRIKNLPEIRFFEKPERALEPVFNNERYENQRPFLP